MSELQSNVDVQGRGLARRRVLRAGLVVTSGIVAGAGVVDAQDLRGIFGKLGKNNPSNNKLALGLKEALEIGLGNAVTLVGQTDGYFANQLIKILMPEKLRPMERALGLLGLQPKIDEFVLGMNRAAEQAAPMAKGIFKEALVKMTFTDAKQILTGPQTAATDYFKGATSSSLVTAFRPPVAAAMQQVGVIKSFETLVGRFQKIPFVKKDAFDLEEYVVRKSMDGLFLMVGEEEKKIRTNPAARVTSLLKDVFGNSK